jgi:hypothetical protein
MTSFLPYLLPPPPPGLPQLPGTGPALPAVPLLPGLGGGGKGGGASVPPPAPGLGVPSGAIGLSGPMMGIIGAMLASRAGIPAPQESSQPAPLLNGRRGLFF